jgi:hypothetical protein
MCAETMIGFRDAYGHALWDYLRGKGRGYEVIERDDGYVDISGGRFIPPRGPLYVAVIFKADRVPSSASG